MVNIILGLLGLIYSVNSVGVFDTIPDCAGGCSVPITFGDSDFKVKTEVKKICADSSGVSISKFNISVSGADYGLNLFFSAELNDIVFEFKGMFLKSYINIFIYIFLIFLIY